MFESYGLDKPEWLQMNGGVGVRVSLITKNAVENAVENVTGSLTDNQKQILSLMKSKPSVSEAELSVELGIHVSNIDRNIRKLKRQGLIVRIGPDKGGYWKVIEKRE